jgi:hypothetical protein
VESGEVTAVRLANRLRHGVPAGIALALVSGLGACTDSPEPIREGPAASWSLQVARIDQGVAVVGDVVVVPDERAVRAVTRSAGKEIWRRDIAGDYTMTIASGLVVVRSTPHGPVEVIDPVSGTTRWQASETDGGVVVQQDAIYLAGCGAGAEQSRPAPDRCTVTARDVRDGRTRWAVRGGSAGLADEVIGVRLPYVPAAGPFLGVALGVDDRPWAAVDVRTGQPLPRRLKLASGWYTFIVGSTFVTTDHDPPSGDSACTVTVTTVDARTGAERSGRVFGGRTKEGECVRRLVPQASGLTLIGSGSRIAASTAKGRPQVYDLLTGGTVWEGDEPGVPIDGNGRSVLIRTYADEGALAVRDFESGAVRWIAPDPGLSGSSASWDSTVTDRLVAVSGATGERPFVLVYEAESGRRLARLPSWLAGAGDDWVAVTRGASGDRLLLDFVPL